MLCSIFERSARLATSLKSLSLFYSKRLFSRPEGECRPEEGRATKWPGRRGVRGAIAGCCLVLIPLLVLSAEIVTTRITATTARFGNMSSNLVKGNLQGNLTGSVTGNVRGKVFGNLSGNVTGRVNGTYVITSFTNLSAAKVVIGSTKATLEISTDQAVNTLTLPSTLTIKPINGALITIAIGKTLTINGTLVDPGVQCFTGSGTVAGLKKSKPEWFGVNTTPGTTDMTTAVQKAIDSTTGTVYLSHGIYGIKSVTITSAGALELDTSATIKMLTPDIPFTPAFAITANDYHFEAYGLIDANSTSRSIVTINANRVVCRLHKTKNVTSDLGATGDTSGVLLNGGTGSTLAIAAETYSNTGNVNGSYPRVVTVQGTTDQYKIEWIRANDCVNALTTGSAVGTGMVDIIQAIDMTDNGVYNLGKGFLSINVLEYYGSDEAAVCEGNLSIGRLLAYGDGVPLGIQANDAETKLHVGSLELTADSSGLTPVSILRTRAGNTLFGSVIIDRISGYKIKLNTLLKCDVGLVGSVVIQNMAITVDYTASTSTGISFCNLSGIKSFVLTDWDLTLVDVDSIGAVTFNIQLPSANLASPSIWRNINWVVLNAVGGVHASSSMRANGVAQALIHWRGVTFFETGGSIYAMGRNASNNIDSIYAIPTAGVWKVGERLQKAVPVAGQAKAWVVTVAGGAYSVTRANTTAYALGVNAKWTTGTTVWICTTAGTSDASPPDITGKVVGNTVTDGTVVWTMTSLTAATSVSEGNL